MFKMIIQMNEEKILQEQIYSLPAIYNALDTSFSQIGFSIVEDPERRLAYCSPGTSKDLAYLGLLFTALKKEDWFLDNVSTWLLCDNEHSNAPDEFNEEDLLETIKRHAKKEA